MAKKRRAVDSHDGVTPKKLAGDGQVLQVGDVPSPESAPQQLEPVLSEVEGPISPPEPESEGKPYTLGIWRGRTQWRCKLCPWDTLKGEAAMLEHIASAHKPPASPILIADKRGNPINRR